MNNTTTIRACCTCLDQHFCVISRRCPDKSLKYWTYQPVSANEETREFSRAELEAEEHRQRMLDRLNERAPSPLWKEFDDEQLAWMIESTAV
jgi:hypothetical protein